MAHYPYVNLAGSAGGCTTELTQIAASASSFTQTSNVITSEEYYAGNSSGSGWDDCERVTVCKPGSKITDDFSNSQ